ncbi:MAG TPA: type II secretion system F family protein [Acidimicrobiales bacterium]
MSPVLLAALGASAGVLLTMVAVQGVEPMVSLTRAHRRIRSNGADRSIRARSVLPERAARAWAAVASGLLGAESRRRRRADRDLPSFLDQVTRHLRTGAALPGAVQAAATGRTEPTTTRLAADLAARTPLTVAVGSWHTACPTPARDLASAALTLAADAGGSVAAVLDGVTETLRDRVALDREVAALSSQARASAAVLVVAPAVFAVLAAMADPRVARMLLGEPLGWACLAGGALLDAAGALWMSRLVGGAR